MIGDVLVFLKDRLDGQLRARLGSAEEAAGDKVVFLEGDKMDPVSFKLGAVTLLLINVEEERVLRAPDPYSRLAPDGTRVTANPDIRVNLYVLFVARFKQYEQAWRHLSEIIKYFQVYRSLDHHNAPELGSSIEKLTLELVTLDFSGQNEVWNALRTTYHPSLLYRVKLIVFRDAEVTQPAAVRDHDIRTMQ
jgi:hypothetical protein